MKRLISVILILVLFLTFSIFMHCKKQTNVVLNVLEPSVLQVDLNNNGVIDDNENVCIPDIEVFSLNLHDNISEMASKFNLSTDDVIAVGYLADEYSRNLLFLKPVKVKLTKERNLNCRFGEIFIDDEKYSDKLYAEGFASKNGKFSDTALKNKILSAQKLKLVILNHKSYKYHKTNCEYGLQSSDYTIIPASQLPKEAKACKFCHVKKSGKKSDTSTKSIPKPAILQSEGDVKLILTDFTTTLKPNRKCDSDACLAVKNAINSANVSIDIAAYGWDNIPALHDALVAAKSRGVRLRVVYDRSSKQEKQYYKETYMLTNLAHESMSDFVQELPAFTDQLMHNKFLIFDNKTVITGSMNLSSTGLSGFNSNSVLIINSADVADLYTAEFEQMLSGKFHNRKSSLNRSNRFVIGNTRLSVWFSPYDKSVAQIIPLIDGAKNYIYLPTFLITHTDLTNALIRAKQRGVDVRIIIDANNTSTRNTKHALLRQNNILLKTENYAGKMHSKSIIIDDKYIVTGSMNFSNSGENKNDENLVIIENVNLAKFYKNFFLYLWAKIPDKWLTKNARAEGKDSIGSCNDGIDNNFDGKIDSADAGCTP